MLTTAKAPVGAAHNPYPSATGQSPANTAGHLPAQGSKAKTAGFVIDLDELAQGCSSLQAALRKLIGGKSLQPVQADTAPGGVSDFSVSMGLGVLTGVVAGLAIRGGWNDAREAIGRSGPLQQRLDACRQALPSKDDAVAASKNARAQLAMQIQECDDLEFEIRRNRLAMGIGTTCCASGVAMLTRTVEESALQIGLTIAAKGCNVSGLLTSSPLAATLSAVSGLVGTVVLGPLAGLLATALGGCYFHQSRKVHCRLSEDRSLVDARLQPEGCLVGEKQAYRAFLRAKLDKRIAFIRRFRNWNAVFLAGGVVFSAVALVKGAIGVAALIGIGMGILSGPIGLLVLLVAGTIGAVALTVGSGPFITKGAKNKRHQAQSHDDHLEVERDVLAAIDVLTAGEDGAEAPGQGQGFSLRSQLYVHIVARKAALNAFLTSAVFGLDKFHDSVADVSAPADAGRRLSKLDITVNVGWRRRFKAGAMACRAFLYAIAVGKGFKAARQAGGAAYRRYPPSVTVAELVDRLAELGGLSSQRTFMHETLHLQAAYLGMKVDAMSAALVARAGEEEGGSALHLRIAAARKRDQQKLREITALCQDVERMSENNAIELTRRFLAVQTGVNVDDIHPASARRQFAEYCLQDAAPQLGEMAGILLATEMQVARIHRPGDA